MPNFASMLIYTKKQRTMKNKIIAIMMTLLLTSSSAWSKGIEEILAGFKETEGVEYVEMTKETIFQMLGGKDGKLSQWEENKSKSDGLAFLKRLSKLVVVNIDSAKVTQTEGLRKDVDKIIKKEYKLLVKASDEEDNVKIYSKGEEKKISEFFIIVEEADEKNIVLILLKGDFNLKDMDFINQGNGNFMVM